jgi:hypothetical protein
LSEWFSGMINLSLRTPTTMEIERFETRLRPAV